MENIKLGFYRAISQKSKVVEVLRQSKKHVWFKHTSGKFKYPKERFKRDFIKENMREISRIDRVLHLLELFWKAHPDFRLGQIISFVSNMTCNNNDAFYMEDDILELELKRWVNTKALSDIMDTIKKTSKNSSS